VAPSCWCCNELTWPMRKIEEDLARWHSTIASIELMSIGRSAAVREAMEAAGKLRRDIECSAAAARGVLNAYDPCPSIEQWASARDESMLAEIGPAPRPATVDEVKQAIREVLLELSEPETIDEPTKPTPQIGFITD
jgi:hypothetical protein